MSASAVVAIDHMLRGTLWPQSVFGVATSSDWRWLEHAGWVAFEDMFLMIACLQSRREMHEIARRRAELETVNDRIEAEVEARTAQLLVNEKALATARDAAEAASRAKTEFLANMSHEIRTPMTAVLGFADMLLEPELTPDQRESHVQVIRRNGNHLLKVIDDILDISKIESGKMTVERISCDPAAVIAEVMSLVGVRASEKKLRLNWRCATAIPGRIKTDPTRLRQILINVLANAVKFTADGSVTLTVQFSDTIALGPRLEFAVADTGVGMSAGEIARIFTPFTQADTSTVRKFGGTGLGLSIARRLTHMLGGDLTVSSTPGRGSTFTVSIPTGPVEGVPLVLALAESHPVAMRQPTRPDGSPRLLDGMRILLADDGPDNQRLIGYVLRLQGAIVRIVSDGQIACDDVIAAEETSEPFDCVILDMQMPVLDGYAAASRLRMKGYGGPIVALTAHAMESDRQRCISSGCTEYATKPIDRAKLVALIASVRPAVEC